MIFLKLELKTSLVKDKAMAGPASRPQGIFFQARKKGVSKIR